MKAALPDQSFKFLFVQMVLKNNLFEASLI